VSPHGEGVTGSLRPEDGPRATRPELVDPVRRNGDGLLAEAHEAAARISTVEQPWGRPGRRLVDPRSPFLVGMVGAAGVAVTFGLVEILVTARDVLVLIGLALFIAVGLQPVVAWLDRRGLPRWAAVAVVCVGLLGVTGGFLAAAIPALVAQTSAFVTQAPTYLRALTDHASFLGQLNDRFHLQQGVEQTLSSGAALLGGVLGAGVIVLNVVGSTLVVLVLTVYFLGALPRLRTGMHRLVPHSRRPRVILLSDEIAARVGGYVLGNAVISVIAGTLTFIWLLGLGVPYPLLLAIGVALLDLIPVVGSTVGGVVVVLVSLTVSLPVALATAVFFVVYRLVEDYLLVPKIIGRAVRVSALATVVAVLFGGVLFGIIGALVAIPAAAAIQLIFREVAAPRLDRA
jgi:predicted PurR-regulated permease PerM